MDWSGERPRSDLCALMARQATLPFRNWYREPRAIRGDYVGGWVAVSDSDRWWHAGLYLSRYFQREKRELQVPRFATADTDWWVDLGDAPWIPEAEDRRKLEALIRNAGSFSVSDTMLLARVFGLFGLTAQSSEQYLMQKGDYSEELVVNIQTVVAKLLRRLCFEAPWVARCVPESWKVVQIQPEPEIVAMRVIHDSDILAHRWWREMMGWMDQLFDSATEGLGRTHSRR